MYGVEDVAAVLAEDFATLCRFVVDLFGGAEGERFLGVYAAAPEDDVIAVFFLERGFVHPRRRPLNGIQDIAARVDHVGDKRLDRAAAMDKHFPVRMAVDPIVYCRKIRLVEVSECFDRAKCSDLRAEIRSARKEHVRRVTYNRPYLF